MGKSFIWGVIKEEKLKLEERLSNTSLRGRSAAWKECEARSPAMVKAIKLHWPQLGIPEQLPDIMAAPHRIPKNPCVKVMLGVNCSCTRLRVHIR